MAEHDAGDEDHRKGAGKAGEETDQRQHDDGGREAHGRQQSRRGDERQQTDPPLVPMGPAIGRKNGAGEIADEIGRGDEPGITRRQAEIHHHRRQDRRIGEASEAHGDGHGDGAGSRGGGDVGLQRSVERGHIILLRRNTTHDKRQ